MVSLFASPSSRPADRRHRDRMVPAISAFPRAAHRRGQRWRRGSRRSPKVHRNLPVGRLVPLQGTAGISPSGSRGGQPSKRTSCRQPSPKSYSYIHRVRLPDFGSRLLRRTSRLVLEVQIEIVAVRGWLAVLHAVDLKLVQVVIPPAERGLDILDEGRTECNRQPESAARSPV